MGKKQKKIKLLTLDTETYNGLIGDLKKIAIYDGSTVYYGNSFTDLLPIIKEFKRQDYEIHIYVHNMEFDMRKIPELFEGKNIIWKNSLIINGKVAKIQCRDYCLHDSFKILPMGLSKLSKGFDVEHGKLSLYDAIQERYPKKYDILTDKGKIDENKTLVNFLDKCPLNDDLFLEYLGYDVMSLYEVLEKLMEITGIPLSKFVTRVSTASMSRYLFKNGWKDKKFKGELSSKSDYEMLCSYKWEYDLETEEFLRESYCGGRTEVFKPKLTKKGFHYDVNSLYPSVMIGAEFPIGKPDYTDKPERAKLMYETWKEDRLGLGFVNATVFIPKQHIPPLPVKMGKLTFPCGYVYGTWTYEELEYAEKECGVVIQEYHGACHFKNTYPVFDRFIGGFYKLKEQATHEKNEPLRMLAKLILNVAYGYTGMRRDDKTGLDSIENVEEHDKIIFMDEEIGFIEFPQDINAEYIQVQVASYVTSRARLVLLKALKDVEKRGGNPYYCDTDSVVSDIPFSADIVDSEKIGYWDLESEPLKALFLRPKVYTEFYEKEETNIKFKGVSTETQKSLSYGYYEYLYEELIKNEKDYEIVEKNKLQMRSILYMEKHNISHDYYEIRDKKMNFKTVEKRIMDYKGNKTEPHYFSTIEEFKNFNYNKIQKHVNFSMT